jgi:hypothetical protein
VKDEQERKKSSNGNPRRAIGVVWEERQWHHKKTRKGSARRQHEKNKGDVRRTTRAMWEGNPKRITMTKWEKQQE